MGSGPCGFERHRGREGFNHAAMNGGGGFAVELLIDDAFDECFKGGLRAGYAELEGTGALDELAQFGIGGRKIQTGFRGIIAGWTRIVSCSRHVLTVSQGEEECLARGY